MSVRRVISEPRPDSVQYLVRRPRPSFYLSSGKSCRVRTRTTTCPTFSPASIATSAAGAVSRPPQMFVMAFSWPSSAHPAAGLAHLLIRARRSLGQHNPAIGKIAHERRPLRTAPTSCPSVYGPSGPRQGSPGYPGVAGAAPAVTSSSGVSPQRTPPSRHSCGSPVTTATSCRAG